MEIVLICFIILMVLIIVSIQLKKEGTENKETSNYQYTMDYPIQPLSKKTSSKVDCPGQPLSRETRRNIVENMGYSSDNKKDEVELVVNLNIKSQTDLQKAEIIRLFY